MKGSPYSAWAQRLCITALVAFAIWLAVGCSPSTVSADAPNLSRIKQSIEKKGLDWVAKDYGRTFSTGALLEPDLKEPPTLLDTPRLKNLPSQLDWRNKEGNWISPVVDQGYCGSCWSFAGVAAVESLYAIWQGTPGTFVDLSEQLLLSCCSGDCGGGYVSEAAAFLQEQGTCPESCFPYYGDTRACSNACSGWQDSAIKIAEYHAVSRSVEAIKQALQDGPLQVSYVATEDFYCYAEGIYEYTGTDPIVGGHAVLAVGYVDTPGFYGGGYFIVKNSWGTNWGEYGFFRIGYSQVNDPTIEFGRSAYCYVMQAPSPDTYEPDNTSAQAAALEPWIAQSHSIRPAGDIDWASFTLDAETEIVLSTSGDSSADPRMWLYSGQLDMIEFDDDGGEGYHAAITRTLPAGQYLVKVDCFWPDRIIDAYSLSLGTTSGAPQVSIDLGVGWHLVSLPLAPANPAIDAVLASIAGKYGIVMAYDLPSDEWLYYDPTTPGAATLEQIDETTAFWIDVTESTTLEVEGALRATTTQSLGVGWNLIAYPSLTARSVPDALASINNQYDQVLGFDATSPDEWQRFNVGRPDWTNTLHALTWGNAYWVHVTSACILTIEN